MTKDFLPLGTIVKLKKEKEKSIMICGRIVLNIKSNYVFDYCGCYYPVGIYSLNSIISFDQEDISEVIHIGYQNDEEEELQQYIRNKIETFHL